MKLNGSSKFYIMNKDIASKTRLDAFESLVNTSLPDREMYRYKADNGVVTDIMSTYHNYEDSKLILKYLIAKSGLVGVDILLVTFQTIFRGDKIRTAYKMCYTCGAKLHELIIYDLEPHGCLKIDLMKEMANTLYMPTDMRHMIEDMFSYNKFIPMFKNVNKVKYTAER